MKSFLRVKAIKLAVGLLLATLFGVAAASIRGADVSDNIYNYLELLRSDGNSVKVELVNSIMKLSAEEAKKFWPIYDAYQKDLEQLDHKLGQTIKEYAEAFNKGPIPDPTAKKLLNEALSVEEQETKLKRSYTEKLEKVLPFSKVARYIQIETKIRSLVRMELAQQIPLAY